MAIYCNIKKLGEPDFEYVYWLDIMGTKSKMLNSVKGSANFIFKLHAVVLEKYEKFKENLILYPVMDGVYITTKSCDILQGFLSSVFYSLSKEFIEANKYYHRFFVKAAVAYGPVYHGRELPDEVNRIFSNNPNYKSSMLIGAPMVQAFEVEHKAPPFGIFIHESARTFPGLKEKAYFTTAFWKWHYHIKGISKSKKAEHLKNFRRAYKQQYEWLRNNSHELVYNLERLAEHEKMIEQYFAFDNSEDDGIIINN